MKRLVKVKIIGFDDVIRDEVLSYVNIYQDYIDYKTFKRSISGFTVEDFPYTEEFSIVTGRQFVRRVMNIDDIYAYRYPATVNDEIYVEKASGEYLDNTGTYPVIRDINDQVVFGYETEREYFWLHKEKIRILMVFENENNTSQWKLSVKRGQFGTISKRYKGLSKYRDNEFQNRNYLETNKRSLIGIRVELYDVDESHENELLAVGVIKGYSIRSGVTIIDCDDIMKTLDIDIPASKRNRNLDSEEDIPFGINTMLQRAFISDIYYYNGSYDPNGEDVDIGFFYETAPEISPYFEEQKITEFINALYYTPMLDNRGVKLSEVLFLAEILQMTFLIFRPAQKGLNIIPTKFFKTYSTFDNIEIEKIELLSDHNRPDYITDPAQTPAFFVLEFNNGKYRYNMLNKVGLVGEGEITMKFSCDVDTNIVKQVTDVVLGYSKIIDYAVAIVKTEMPELLIREKYKVGEFYEVTDISELETFQVKGQEQFKMALCIKIDDEQIEFMITGYNIYAPIAPMLTISRAIQSTPTLTSLVFTKEHLNNEGLYQMIEAAITSYSPFETRGYFIVGEYLYCFDDNFEWIETVQITELLDDGAEQYIRFNSSQASLIRYVTFPDYGDPNISTYQAKFLRIGVSKWM